MKNFFPYLFLFVTIACGPKQTRFEIQCTKLSKISFVDPKRHSFYLISSDTFSDHSQEWLIYRSYKSTEDSFRYFTTHNDEGYIIDCSALEKDYSMEIQTRRLYNNYGVWSINEKFHYEKDGVNLNCLRFEKYNYIISFCMDSNYVRVELFNFCSPNEFKDLLKTIKFKKLR